MFDGFPRGFQQQAVLRVDRRRFPLVDPEEVRVKAADVVHECAPPRHRPARNPRLGVVVLVGVPSIRRNLGDQIIAAQ